MEKVDHFKKSPALRDAFRFNQFTRAERISALSSAIIAFVTVLGLMVGLYYNLRATNTKLFDIFIFESIFIVTIFSIIVWLMHHMKEED